MKIAGYEIDLEQVIKLIKDNNFKRLLLQVPEGLKTYVSEFIEFLENKTNISVIVFADPCFGACDVCNYDLKNLDIDLIVQIGHTPIPDIEKSLIPTIFVNAISDLDVSKVIKNL